MKKVKITSLSESDMQSNILKAFTSGSSNIPTVFKIQGTIYTVKVIIDVMNTTTATNDGGNCVFYLKLRSGVLKSSLLYSEKKGSGFSVRVSLIENIAHVEINSPGTWQYRRIKVVNLGAGKITPELSIGTIDTSNFIQII